MRCCNVSRRRRGCFFKKKLSGYENLTALRARDARTAGRLGLRPNRNDLHVLCQKCFVVFGAWIGRCKVDRQQIWFYRSNKLSGLTAQNLRVHDVAGSATNTNRQSRQCIPDLLRPEELSQYKSFFNFERCNSVYRFGSLETAG